MKAILNVYFMSLVFLCLVLEAGSPAKVEGTRRI